MSLLPQLGEYSSYVWSCFLLFAALLIWDLITPALRLRRLKRDLMLRSQRDAARKAGTESPH